MAIELIPKPWGHEEIWAKTDRYVGKKLFIKKWHRLSLQYHKVKEETIFVLEGRLYFHCGDKKMEYILDPGDTWHIKPGWIHRMEAKDVDVIVMEVSTPELDDVVRLEDSYGRK